METVTVHVNLMSGALVEAGYENEMLEEASQCHSRSLCVYLILDFRVNFFFGPFITPWTFRNLENLKNCPSLHQLIVIIITIKI